MKQKQEFIHTTPSQFNSYAPALKKERKERNKSKPADSPNLQDQGERERVKYSFRQKWKGVLQLFTT